MPQFGLAALLWSIAAFSVLFATLTVLSITASVLTCWFLCLVLFHVTAASLGTRLSEKTTRQLQGELRTSNASDAAHSPAAVLGSRRMRPAARLQSSTPVGILTVVTAAVGALAAGIFGALALSSWGSVTVPGLIVGAISSSLLGAIFGGLAASFLTISTKAIREAARES